MHHEIRLAIRDNLRHFRRKRGLTQQGLAELCGVSAASIVSIETARRTVSLELLSRLAAALEIEGWRLLLPPDVRERSASELLHEEIRESIMDEVRRILRRAP